ncbi:hypothetical protein ACJX0J_007298, partial [Zea mays]
AYFRLILAHILAMELLHEFLVVLCLEGLGHNPQLHSHMIEYLLCFRILSILYLINLLLCDT